MRPILTNEQQKKLDDWVEIELQKLFKTDKAQKKYRPQLTAVFRKRYFANEK